VRVFLAMSALTAVLAGCTQGTGPETSLRASADADRGAAGLCPALLDYRGHRYTGHGELLRDPTTTGQFDTGSVPSCAGGADRKVQVAELAEIPSRRAVLVDGTLYVRADRPFPDAARRLFEAPTCRTTGRFTVRGAWLSVQGPREPRFDGDLRAPYRLGVHVEHGPPRYRSTTIQIRATTRTAPTLRPRDVKSSLWRGGDLIAEVRCIGHSFSATSLTSTPG
jgi:hypothetical protein